LKTYEKAMQSLQKIRGYEFILIAFSTFIYVVRRLFQEASRFDSMVTTAELNKVPFLELKATFTDAFEAIPYLQQYKKMPDISGIEFVRILQKTPMIIFTTAYSEYALNGFELDAVDYLMKPFSIARFTKACNKVLEIKLSRSEESHNFIFLKTGYEEEKVLLDDILFIEVEGNYMLYVLSNKKLLCRQNIGECMNQLPTNQFIRFRRSYIVALSKIQKITRQSV